MDYEPDRRSLVALPLNNSDGALPSTGSSDSEDAGGNDKDGRVLGGGGGGSNSNSNAITPAPKWVYGSVGGGDGWCDPDHSV